MRLHATVLRTNPVQMEPSERVKPLKKQRNRAGCVNPCESKTRYGRAAGVVRGACADRFGL